LGQPKLLSRITIIRAVSLFSVPVLGFSWFGVPGAVWGVVLSYLFPVPLILFYQIQHRLFDARRELMLILVWPVGLGTGALFNLVARHFFSWIA
jgi:hypothetical protein